MPNQLDRIAAARQDEQMERPHRELLKMGEATRANRERRDFSSPYVRRGRTPGKRCRRVDCENMVVGGSRDRLCQHHLAERLAGLKAGNRRYR